jgi:hypothetical protein
VGGQGAVLRIRVNFMRIRMRLRIRIRFFILTRIRSEAFNLDADLNLTRLKVPKCEIFDRSDIHNFYTIKPFWVGDFG